MTINRRKFIRTTGNAAAGLIGAPIILNSCRTGGQVNDRINLAHIGVGSRGQSELKNYFVPLETSYSVATCDPFRTRREGAAAFVNKKSGRGAPDCVAIADYKEVLERDDIDAVHITTPDHWHVPMAILAARAGKHIMLAKPLGLSYSNYMVLQKELLSNDVRFHYGTQQRTMKHLQLGVDMISNGLIGEVEKVLVWAPGYNNVPSPVCKESKVPADFDYDMWTGPAPLNSYCPERVTNNSSWFQWDYSIGFLAGWGAHPLDVMVWALKDKMTGQYSCEGVGAYWAPGGMYNNIREWDVALNYENGLQLHFVDTDTANRKDLIGHSAENEGNGTTFYGSKGWISLSRSSAQSNIPELHGKLNDFPKDKRGRIRSEENTMGQLFVDVVKGNIQEACPLDEAILSDCISHLSNIAIRTGRKVQWDPVTGKVINDPEANAWFSRDLREPYVI